MLAFGHLIGAWFFGEIYKWISGKKISHHTWFFLLLGGILPDADFILDWTLKTNFHRTFSHSLLFMVFLTVVPYLFCLMTENKKGRTFSLVLGAGLLVHLLLDFVPGQGIPLFWPSVWLLIPSDGIISIKYAIFDMALGTSWIFYLWYKKKIRF